MKRNVQKEKTKYECLSGLEMKTDTKRNETMKMQTDRNDQFILQQSCPMMTFVLETMNDVVEKNSLLLNDFDRQLLEE